MRLSLLWATGLAALSHALMPAPGSLANPRSQCDRYTDETYAKMRDDTQRTDAYAAAIAKAAPGAVCLDIGTGALALLAVMAAKAGARHVYAVEANTAAAEAARRAVEDHGVADRVTVLEAFSTDVVLPEPVELLLHEIIGEIAGYEGVGAAITDAAARHLAPAPAAGAGGARRVVSVPARARSLVAPAEFPPPEYFASLPFPMLAAPGARVLKLPSLPRAVLLAPPATFEDLRFEDASPQTEQDVELAFTASRAGELRGLAVHVEVFTLDGDAAAPDISSAGSDSHWPNVFLMLPGPLPVAEGQRITVRAMSRLGGEQPRYAFEVRDAEGGVLGSMEYPENM